MTDRICNIMGILTVLVLFIFFILFIVCREVEKQDAYCNCIKRCENCGKVVHE